MQGLDPGSILIEKLGGRTGALSHTPGASLDFIICDPRQAVKEEIRFPGISRQNFLPLPPPWLRPLEERCTELPRPLEWLLLEPLLV